MKKIVRLLALSLVLAGSYSAYSSSFNTTKTGFMNGGDPMPLCDPSNPACKIW